jgi:hypothetical protein
MRSSNRLVKSFEAIQTGGTNLKEPAHVVKRPLEFSLHYVFRRGMAVSIPIGTDTVK